MITQFYKIKKAKEKADYIILIVHGGIEQYSYPSPRMKKTYRFFIDAGADAVINHHQHYSSGYEIYKNKPIVYGLGNLLFNSGLNSSTYWNTGYMVQLLLDGPQTDYRIIPYQQSKEKPKITTLKGTELQSFHKRLEKLNAVIGDDNQLEKNYQRFLLQKNSVNENLLTPYSSKYLTYAYSKGLLPSFISKKKALILLNRIECESLRESLIAFLKDRIK